MPGQQHLIEQFLMSSPVKLGSHLVNMWPGEDSALWPQSLLQDANLIVFSLPSSTMG